MYYFKGRPIIYHKSLVLYLWNYKCLLFIFMCVISSLWRHSDVTFWPFLENNEIHENYSFSLSYYFSLKATEWYGIIFATALFCGIYIVTIHSSQLHIITSNFCFRFNLWSTQKYLTKSAIMAPKSAIEIICYVFDIIGRPIPVSYTHLTLPTKRIV